MRRVYQQQLGKCPQCGYSITWTSDANTPWYHRMALWIGWARSRFEKRPI